MCDTLFPIQIFAEFFFCLFKKKFNVKSINETDLRSNNLSQVISMFYLNVRKTKNYRGESRDDEIIDYAFVW